MSRRLVITGWGSIGPGGIGGTLDRREAPPRTEQVTAEKLRWRHVSSRPNDRFGRLDPASQLSLAAAEMLGLPLPGPDDSSPRTGIVLESSAGSLAVDAEFLAELGRGIASPALFTYTLPSAGLAEIAIRFRITGPTTCLMAENTSSSIALWEALELLRSGEIDACLCVACDAFQADPGRADAVLVEGAESAIRAGRRALASLEGDDGRRPGAGVSLAILCDWLSNSVEPTSEGVRVGASPLFPSGLQVVLRRGSPE